MPRRLTLALALSLALHGGVLLPDALQRRAATPPPALQATLRLPPKPETAPVEPLLKNTLDTEEAQPISQPQPVAKPQPSQKTVVKREIQAAQKKLSKYVFYPEAARVRGIEGTVYLMLSLSADGTVEDVKIVASSGHPILDNEAAKGAWAIQKLPGATTRELPLGYTFRLIP